LKKTVLLFFILALGLTGNFMVRKGHSVHMPVSKNLHQKEIPGNPADSGPTPPQFRCDGRTYCSQMTSCEEAKFFLENCPGVKMDGDNDGVPCESQWCK
jgi:hypothetical protein